MTTLAELNARIRQRADKVNSLFVTDAEITSMINASYAELYDLIIQSSEDYFTTSTTLTVTSSDAGVASLPASFYKLRGLDYLIGGNYVTVYSYDWGERNLQNLTAMPEFTVRYRVMGSTLRLEPGDLAAGTYRLWYIPAYTALSAAGDVLNTQITRQNWEEYLVVDVAAKILDKEESNSSHLVQAKEILRNRIQQFSASRDLDQPMRVTDVRSIRDMERWRGGGF